MTIVFHKHYCLEPFLMEISTTLAFYKLVIVSSIGLYISAFKQVLKSVHFIFVKSNNKKSRRKWLRLQKDPDHDR